MPTKDYWSLGNFVAFIDGNKAGKQFETADGKLKTSPVSFMAGQSPGLLYPEASETSNSLETTLTINKIS